MRIRRCLTCNKDLNNNAASWQHRKRGHEVVWLDNVTGATFKKYPGQDDSNGSEPAKKVPVTDVPAGAPAVGKSKVTNLSEADYITFIPKSFTINSTLIKQAMIVTEREWHWPTLSPEDWIDTYLYITMKQRGVLLGAYKVLEKKEEPHGS